ncbi:MAG: transposase [Pirellulaceae bacterium]|nr:transposase [Pirellulaceae bacterium]
MGSKPRNIEPGYVYHVLNRGAERRRLFFSDEDYSRFEDLIEETHDRIPLRLFTYELMPNHWHFVARPADKDELPRFFQYLASVHAKRFRAAHQTCGYGHVYQDRFRSFPVQSDGHFLTLCRYVERNALRAGLVDRCENWRWSGLWRRLHECDYWLDSAWPVPRPGNWIDRVNQPLTAAELAAVRHSIRRGSPLGAPQWARDAAKLLGLGHTLREPGRPAIIGAH